MRQLKNLFRKNIQKTLVKNNFIITNFWQNEDYTTLWFYKFLEHRKLLNENITYNFISVFGDTPTVEKKQVNIFFCGENTNLKIAKKYKNHLLDRVDIALGFDYINHKNYLRFPIWILYIVPPNASYKDLVNILESYKNKATQHKNIEFSLVASHDNNGIRTKVVNLIEKHFSTVICPGKFNHNTNILKEKYNDNKLQYLEDVKFNICPENSNANGYVTEKLFEALSAGCIPIYWGANSNPEPEILIKESILFYDEKQEFSLINKIKEANKNNILKPILKDNAAEIIWSWIVKFETLINEKIKEK